MDEEKKITSEKQLKAVKHARESRRVAEPYNTKFAKIGMRMAASGATLADIAYLLGTNKTNLNKWKKDNPEFKKALNRGLELTQAWLLAKGMKAAAGYKCVDKKVVYTLDKDGKATGDKQVTEFHKTIPANPQLVMFLAGAMGRRLGDESWTTKQFTETKIEKNVNYRIIDSQKIVDHMDKLAGGWGRAIDAEFVEQPKLETNESK